MLRDTEDGWRVAELSKNGINRSIDQRGTGERIVGDLLRRHQTSFTERPMYGCPRLLLSCASTVLFLRPL